MNSITAYIDENKAFVVNDRVAIDMKTEVSGTVVIIDGNDEVRKPANVKLIELNGTTPIYDIELLDMNGAFSIFDVINAVGKLNRFMKYASKPE